MQIEELMTRDVKTCHGSESLHRAAMMMWDHDIGAIPVVNESGQVVGIVTDRDACMAAYLQRQPLDCLPVMAAMSNHVITCRPEDTDDKVAEMMSKNQIRRVPVVDDDQHPVGIVSLNDLALAMARRHDVSADEVADTLAAICEHRHGARATPA